MLNTRIKKIMMALLVVSLTVFPLAACNQKETAKNVENIAGINFEEVVNVDFTTETENSKEWHRVSDKEEINKITKQLDQISVDKKNNDEAEGSHWSNVDWIVVLKDKDGKVAKFKSLKSKPNYVVVTRTNTMKDSFYKTEVNENMNEDVLKNILAVANTNFQNR